MLSWIFLMMVLAAFIIIANLVTSRFVKDHEVNPADSSTAAARARMAETVRENRRALENDDIDAIKFDVVPYGYRQEQVDALLSELSNARQAAAEKPTV